MEQVINIFKTELWTQLSNFIILLVFGGIITSILVEAVKNSSINVFKRDNKMFFWIINIILSIIFGFSLYFMFIFKSDLLSAPVDAVTKADSTVTTITTIMNNISQNNTSGVNPILIIIYPLILSITVWGVSFLAYTFIIKWLFIAFETITNIFKSFKVQSENKIKSLQQEGLKLDSIANEIKSVIDVFTKKEEVKEEVKNETVDTKK